MIVNPDKFHAIVVKKNATKCSYPLSINDQTIKFENSVKLPWHWNI